MLFRSVLVLLAAAATVAALPWYSPPVAISARAVTPTGRRKFLGAKFSPKTTAANSLRRKKGGKGKGTGTAPGGQNNNNGNSTSAAVGDTGITDVIEMCLQADGKTGCSEILGDSKDSCFTIPEPLAGAVKFFVPSPNNTCSLFADEDCTQNETAADGVINNAKQNSWACKPTAA